MRPLWRKTAPRQRPQRGPHKTRSRWRQQDRRDYVLLAVLLVIVLVLNVIVVL